MNKEDKKELYKTLKRENAFIVFLATDEADVSLLPEPFTRTEKMLRELCQEKAEKARRENAVCVAEISIVHSDSEHPGGDTSAGELKSLEEEPKKIVKRTTKKATSKK